MLPATSLEISWPYSCYFSFNFSNEGDDENKKIEKILENPKKVKSKYMTLNLYKEGLSLEEIAQIRGLRNYTIYCHLIDLIDEDYEINYKSSLDEEVEDQILEAAGEQGFSSLGQIQNYLENKINYDDLCSYLLERKEKFHKISLEEDLFTNAKKINRSFGHRQEKSYKFFSQDNFSISEIAKVTGYRKSTIYNHLLAAVENSMKLNYKSYIENEEKEKIIQAIEEIGYKKLSPIRARLNNLVDYQYIKSVLKEYLPRKN